MFLRDRTLKSNRKKSKEEDGAMKAKRQPERGPKADSRSYYRYQHHRQNLIHWITEYDAVAKKAKTRLGHSGQRDSKYSLYFILGAREN